MIPAEPTFEITPSDYAQALYAQGMDFCRKWQIPPAYLRVMADGPEGRWIFVPAGWRHIPEHHERFCPIKSLSVIFPSLDLALWHGFDEQCYTILFDEIVPAL